MKTARTQTDITMWRVCRRHSGSTSEISPSQAAKKTPNPPIDLTISTGSICPISETAFMTKGQISAAAGEPLQSNANMDMNGVENADAPVNKVKTPAAT